MTPSPSWSIHRASWLAALTPEPLAAMSACSAASSVPTSADERPCTTTLDNAASRLPPSVPAPASSVPNVPGDVGSTMPNAPSTSRSACARASAKAMPASARPVSVSPNIAQAISAVVGGVR